LIVLNVCVTGQHGNVNVCFFGHYCFVAFYFMLLSTIYGEIKLYIKLVVCCALNNQPSKNSCHKNYEVLIAENKISAI